MPRAATYLPLDLKRRPTSCVVVAHASSVHLEHGHDRPLLSTSLVVNSLMVVTVMAPGTLSFVLVGSRGDAASQK